MKKLTKKRLAYGLAAGGILLCLLAVIYFKNPSQPETVTEDIPLVRTSVVGLTGLASNYSYSGEVRGRYESQLAFQVSGKIIKRNVELGSVVSPGDVLMQIDPRDTQQGVNSSAAQVSSAQSQLQLAEKNLNRYRSLYEQNAISKAEYDIYQNAYNAAEATLRQATAQNEQNINQLNYCNLYADIGGVVAGIDAETGQVVAAGQTVISVVQDGEREVEINVPENRLEELRKAKQIKVKFWALANVVVDGKVREIAPIADEVSRTYKVRISLLNPPAQIKLGMTSSVAVTGAVQQQKAVSIPLSAIYQKGDTPAVWVVNSGVVQLRTVKTGEFGVEQIQVLEGLEDGDVIVTAGVHKLREGQKVSTTGDAK